MRYLTIPIRGMHCASCEILIGNELKKIIGVIRVKVDQIKGQAEIHYHGSRPPNDQLAKAVQTAGYQIGEPEKIKWLSRNPADYADLGLAALLLTALYLLAQATGILDLTADSKNEGLWVPLIVGLVAGVSSCMALIGGLVLGLSARHADRHPEATASQKFIPHLYFNLGRIAGYAFFGGLIGLVGKAFSPSPNLLGIMTMLVGVVMVFLGLKLIEIFPALRYRSITLPSSLARFLGIGAEVKEYSHKKARMLGALTFFLPCGFTQAMQLYAVSSGSFMSGALIMGLFALGTAPGLLSIGGLTSIVKGNQARILFMTAGLMVLIFGLTNINNGRQLFAGFSTPTISRPTETSDVQIVRMTQHGSGYRPNILTVERGRPIKWIINSTSPYSCAASIFMPTLGIRKILKAGENIITFTPQTSGEIPFSCSMGMYRGKFIVK